MAEHDTLTEHRQKLPRFCLAIYALAAISAVLYVAFRTSTPFADWFNGAISSWGRRVLALLTSWIPFSFAELLLILLPLILIVLIGIAYRHYCASWRDSLVFIGILLAVVAVVWILFVWNFAAGYSATSLDERLELDREKVSAEELYQTAEVLSAKLHELSHEITFLESGQSLMPYSYEQMNQKLLDAYDAFCKDHPFVDSFPSSVKPIMLSEPMSYTHITGVYTFFTGEANINVNFPDYTIPYTAAHELAHQRGIAREDEANFVAFLVCMESNDPYIQYSAYLNVYEYVASALYSANADLYGKSYSKLPKGVLAERASYRKFFEKYKENVAANVSEGVNNSYLISQGNPAGTRSYNMVVDLTVAYFKGNGKID